MANLLLSPCRRSVSSIFSALSCSSFSCLAAAASLSLCTSHSASVIPKIPSCPRIAFSVSARICPACSGLSGFPCKRKTSAPSRYNSTALFFSRGYMCSSRIPASCISIKPIMPSGKLSICACVSFIRLLVYSLPGLRIAVIIRFTSPSTSSLSSILYAKFTIRFLWESVKSPVLAASAVSIRRWAYCMAVSSAISGSFAGKFALAAWITSYTSFEPASS